MSPAPLELFLLSGSPYAWRVQLALEHLGLSYDTHVLSISDGSAVSMRATRSPR